VSTASNSAARRSDAPALCYAGSFLASAVLAARWASSHPRWWWAVAAFVVLGAVGALALHRGARAGPWLALAVLNLLLAVPELGLRAGGYRYVSGVEFGYPEPEQFWELSPDRELFWKLPSDDPLVNSLGFFGPEPVAPKPRGTLRVVYLGDSCSQQGYPNAWPELATRVLAARGNRAVDEINLALSGYSSHQGRVLAERYLARFEPDLVAVYFGWNDHWLAWGAIDSRKRIDPSAEELRRNVRLLQLVHRARTALAGAKVEPLDEVRVPIAEYRDNLRVICERSTAAGAKVVLITAPSAFDVKGVPEHLLSRPFVRDAATLERLHREYNDVVREVASERGALLLDLERVLGARADRGSLFLRDGIHLSESGLLAVAELFANFVRERALAN
jgi:lysophospholipase L1-like esterase